MGAERIDQNRELGQTGSSATTERIEPCEHMAENISALADGTLHGPARWYTQFHSSYCSKCNSALVALKRLRIRLTVLKRKSPADHSDQLSADRMSGIEKAMLAIESETMEPTER